MQLIRLKDSPCEIVEMNFNISFTKDEVGDLKRWLTQHSPTSDGTVYDFINLMYDRILKEGL